MTTATANEATPFRVDRHNIAQAKGYATADNAKRKLDQALSNVGYPRDHRVAFLIAVNDEGRFIPCVYARSHFDFALMHHGVTVIG